MQTESRLPRTRSGAKERGLKKDGKKLLIGIGFLFRVMIGSKIYCGDGCTTV